VNQLIVTVPPRHLKSIIFSVALPTYLLGQDPTKRITCVSYSSELAVKHAINFRAVMNSAWYRRIFPKNVLSREKDTQVETKTTARGFRIGNGRDHRGRPGTLSQTNGRLPHLPSTGVAGGLERMKQIMGELFSSGQYQQEPIPLAGNLTSRDHLFDRRLARPRRISRP
jgi:hypothetical protein